MVQLDTELLSAARRLITGANVHRANTLIFQYQQSVFIRNLTGRSGLDPAKFEHGLREWVVEETKRLLLRRAH